MSKTKKYSYVGLIKTTYRSDFPLLCGCCGHDVDPSVPVSVYFDNGPGDFFLVDMYCAEKIEAHDAEVPRQLAQKR